MSKIPATQKNEKSQVKAKKREDAPKPVRHALEHPTLPTLQNHLGNAAVQRLLAQRSGGDGAFDLDDATAGRINAARSGGQALDGAVQTQMSQSMGTDFSGVRVHTGSEAHQLNEQLSAKAFTTGQDIFFRAGEYNPGSSGGQELIAHELTHVVQQGSGTVSEGVGSGAMRVNAPGDRFEQEADSVAKNVTTASNAPAVQRQTPEEEVQAKRLQRAEMPEEEVQAKRLQRQEMPEEEVQAKALQRQEEEEEAVQMQEEEEEPVQMQEMPEEEEVPA